MSTDYTYKVAWSDDDAQHVGTCLEFPGLSWLDACEIKAREGIQAVVKDVVADMKSNGEPLPDKK